MLSKSKKIWRATGVAFLVLTSAGAAHASQASASFQVGLRIVPTSQAPALAPIWRDASPTAPGFMAVPGPLPRVLSELRESYSDWNISVVQSTEHQWEVVATDKNDRCVRIEARTVVQAPVIRVGLSPCS